MTSVLSLVLGSERTLFLCSVNKTGHNFPNHCAFEKVLHTNHWTHSRLLRCSFAPNNNNVIIVIIFHHQATKWQVAKQSGHQATLNYLYLCNFWLLKWLNRLPFFFWPKVYHSYVFHGWLSGWCFQQWGLKLVTNLIFTMCLYIFTSVSINICVCMHTMCIHPCIKSGSWLKSK